MPTRRLQARLRIVEANVCKLTLGCVNVKSDSSNCGKCGLICNAVQSCCNGVCQLLTTACPL